MPSVILGNPLASGAQQIISGNPWSGKNPEPVGGIQLRWSPKASGSCYIGFSGGMTIASGGFLLSGGAASGFLDGMELGPGDSYFIPKMIFQVSGTYNLFAMCDVAASGVGRLYFEPF